MADVNKVKYLQKKWHKKILEPRRSNTLIQINSIIDIVTFRKI